MILVVADDLSGAAELAGIALAHGLTAEVQTEFHARTEAQVICLDTNTRRLAPTEAATLMQRLSRRLLAARPELIFKKTDSALRGNIGAELTVLLEATARTGAIFVPANPSRGRVIRGGNYFIGDSPLHETDFANDPRHPATTADVAERLGHDPAIAIPEAASQTDVLAAARSVDDLVLPAGAGDFFAALLETRGHPAIPTKITPASGQALFVCGSMAAWGRGRAGHCEARGVPVRNMPPELFGQSEHPAALYAWAETACSALAEHGACMLAIGRMKAVDHAPRLESRLVQAMAMVLAQMEVDRLLLEGGATASAALARLKWKHLRAVDLAAPDLPSLRVDDDAPRMFMKPGSYNWPDSVWPTDG
jgi:uncharacterized protein YgbK (DUF1537 family)